MVEYESDCCGCLAFIINPDMIKLFLKITASGMHVCMYVCMHVRLDLNKTV